MHAISSAADIRVWIANCRPDVVEAGLHEELAECIRTAEDRPRWSTDWSEWLDAHVAEMIEEICAARDIADDLERICGAAALVSVAHGDTNLGQHESTVRARIGGFPRGAWSRAIDILARRYDGKAVCACGCGEFADTTVRFLREQDRGTAEALGWSETAITPMRVSVPVAAGHEEDGIDGYVHR